MRRWSRSRHLLANHHNTMIALCLAFFAVASAAPQLQLQGGQILSAQQIPLGQTYQTTAQYQQLPINYQTVQPQIQSVIQTSQPQYQSVPIQTVQTIQTAQPRLSYQNVPLNVQSLPINTLNYQQVPVQQLRVAQVKPVTQYRTQALRTSVVQPLLKTAVVQPVIQNTVAPLTVQQHVVPQVHNIQVQQRLAQPQFHGVAILRQVQDVQADGTYAFAYETENGIKAQEEGRTLNQGANGESNAVQGSYSYVSPDGETIAVTYVADENGFRAEGDHIPKVPEAIQRSLEYLRSLPARPEDQEGQYVPDKNGY